MNRQNVYFILKRRNPVKHWNHTGIRSIHFAATDAAETTYDRDDTVPLSHRGFGDVDAVIVVESIQAQPTKGLLRQTAGRVERRIRPTPVPCAHIRSSSWRW